MNRNEVIESLGISDNTFRKWCKAWDIPTNKAEYSNEDLEKLEHCQKAMADGMKWDEYLASIGKKSAKQASSGIVNRYLPTRQEAKAVAEGAILAFDAMVAEEFVNLAAKPSPIFAGLFKGLTGQRIIDATLGDSDALYFLEGEIVDE